jgi:hypothetical protein
MAVYDFVRIAHCFYSYSFYFVFYGAISCTRFVAYLHNVAVKVVVLALGAGRPRAFRRLQRYEHVAVIFVATLPEFALDVFTRARVGRWYKRHAPRNVGKF